MSEILTSAEFDRPHDECGVVGIICPNPAGDLAATVVQALRGVQNRGDEGAGVFINGVNGFSGLKNLGRIDEALPQRIVLGLDNAHPNATIGVAHARYGTSSGMYNPFDAVQPFKLSNFTIGHNGQFTNVGALAGEYGLVREDYSTDSHGAGVLIDIAAESLGVEAALSEVLPRLRGGYALVVADNDNLYGARDPHGNRPLMLGRLADREGWILASETAAFRQIGAQYIREVAPGEVVKINNGGEPDSFYLDVMTPRRTCGLEIGYLMRSHSTVPGLGSREDTSAGALRIEIGKRLAVECKFGKHDADMVIGVPESGLAAAYGYAEASGIPLAPPPALTKNSEVRSFMQPSQLKRDEAIMSKLVADPEIVSGKRIVTVDDSVVRGTAYRACVRILREAGAKEVHALSAFPLISRICTFGVDIGRQDELLANQHPSLEAMCKYLGAESIGFISERGYREATGMLGALCMSCVNGEPLPDPRPRR